MAEPKHYCAKCGGKMVYDKDLSQKHHHTVWWCLPCDRIEYYQESHVHHAVTSVKRYIFHGKLD